jgi:CubicO group peptidase (beta-lactamase class C family)
MMAVLLAVASRGGAIAAPPAPTLQQQLDARVAGMPGIGVVVGVIDHGKQSIYVAGQSGNARPLDAHTLFEIGSDTKTFTATVLADMVLLGQVHLSDPVSAYLPGVHVGSKDGRAITLLDLAEQRSGLPRMPTNMDDMAGADPYADYGTADLYAFLNGYALTRAPGASYEYSNLGIGVLGQALANKAGTTYPALLKARVFEPLHMSETTVATVPPNDPVQLAVGHADGAPVGSWHFQALAPAGGIRSNVIDMLKYLRCNMGQGPLARACLLAHQPRADGESGHKIGLVWWTNPVSGVVSHGGDTAGYHAFVAVSKDRQTGVVVMSNGIAVADIAVHVLTPSYPIASCAHAIAPSEVDPRSYVGVYCYQAAGINFHVAPGTSTDDLMIALDPQPALRYVRTGPATFAAAKVGATVSFVLQSGNVVGFNFSQHDAAFRAVRLGAGGQAVVASLPSQFPAEIALDPATLQSYVGTYNGQGISFVVTRRANRLYAQLTGQGAAQIYPSARDAFFYKIVDAQITFARDASNNVVSLTLHQNGEEIVATRASSL